MDSEIEIKEFKKICWKKANELYKDISKTKDYFDFLSSIENLSEQTAYSWCVNAYFEFLKGRWSKERCENQIINAIHIKNDNK